MSRVSTAEIAKWLRRRADGTFWRVEGYVPVTSRISMPTTHDALAEAFAQVDENLELPGRVGQPSLAGDVTAEALDSYFIGDIDGPALYMRSPDARVVRLFQQQLPKEIADLFREAA